MHTFGSQPLSDRPPVPMSKILQRSEIDGETRTVLQRLFFRWTSVGAPYTSKVVGEHCERRHPIIVRLFD